MASTIPMKAKIIAKKCKNDTILQIFTIYFAAISYNKDIEGRTK